jgi:hypothetical protein
MVLLRTLLNIPLNFCCPTPACADVVCAVEGFVSELFAPVYIYIHIHIDINLFVCIYDDVCAVEVFVSLLFAPVACLNMYIYIHTLNMYIYIYIYIYTYRYKFVCVHV